MVKFDRGRPYDTPAGCANTNTQVDIIVSNRKLLVETSDLFEYCAADYHTGRGNAGDVLFETGAAKISTAPARFAMAGMSRDTTHS